MIPRKHTSITKLHESLTELHQLRNYVPLHESGQHRADQHTAGCQIKLDIHLYKNDVLLFILLILE